MNSNYLDQKKKANLEKTLWEQRRKQPGVAFPSALTQEHLLIIRFNISHPITDSKDKEFIRNGVIRLCKFFDRIDKEKIKIDDLTNEGETRIVPLSEFNFSATIGFGMGFFEKLKIDSPNRPKELKEMPNHIGLGDPRPYSIFQTDFIIQLGSDTEDVNRWVFQHSSAKTEQVETMKGAALPSYLSQYKGDGTDDGDIDIFSCISEWAQLPTFTPVSNESTGGTSWDSTMVYQILRGFLTMLFGPLPKMKIKSLPMEHIWFSRK